MGEGGRGRFKMDSFPGLGWNGMELFQDACASLSEANSVFCAVSKRSIRVIFATPQVFKNGIIDAVPRLGTKHAYIHTCIRLIKYMYSVGIFTPSMLLCSEQL